MLMLQTLFEVTAIEITKPEQIDGGRVRRSMVTTADGQVKITCHLAASRRSRSPAGTKSSTKPAQLEPKKTGRKAS